MGLEFSLYALLLAPLVLIHLVLRWRRARHSLLVKAEAIDAGLTEPASLHPIIDPGRCIGCAACMIACPESDVLGQIGDKAELVNPTNCIGHGACREACPTDAIDLVFGTATRGVEIPILSQDFETNVPGIYIAGELGGMGLIRNAMAQGQQAIDSIRTLPGLGRGDRKDVVIVGAGPAGLAASLAAKEAGLSYVTLEQNTLGGTVAHYPRGKIVMTSPVTLPLYGKVRLKETTKEDLLALWQSIEATIQLGISYRERCVAVAQEADGFVVETSGRHIATRAVLLAIGRRGTPRTLGVQGEDLPKVVYQLIDPEQYQGDHVLVVGGGDSALEAACCLAEQPDTTVTLAYRSSAFNRAKRKNRDQLDEAHRRRLLDVMLNAEVQAIDHSHVKVAQQQNPVRLKNDAVIVCAGGIASTGFLASMGIQVETKYGTV